MSWETVVVAYVGLKDGTSREKIERLKLLVEKILEARDNEIVYDESLNSIEVRSINFSSHVDEDVCYFFAKYIMCLDFVKHVDVSLYYILAADYFIQLGEECDEKCPDPIERDRAVEENVVEEFEKIFPEFKACFLAEAIKKH